MMVIVHNASLRAHRRCGSTAAARPRQEEAELELQKIHTPHDLTYFFRGITDEVVSRVRGAPNSSSPMHCALGSSREEPQKIEIEYVES